MDKVMLKMARDKYGSVRPPQSGVKRKSAEESLSCNLSILHDSHCNEEWVKKIKNLIRLTDGGIDLTL